MQTITTRSNGHIITAIRFLPDGEWQVEIDKHLDFWTDARKLKLTDTYYGKDLVMPFMLAICDVLDTV